ncbi:hypothetical protein GR702_04670 [Novosphingobium sp. FGD1]|uniref:Uncharacterized protein n=1 Tax=Novosphingobium silvae TaxID=2692619 RepID=A0A7X4GF18_9SPHN|nr:hypothetical protein [Novosphingobium silvae]MYL97066.1 hypothetical protein [Novosphingobium silvae]
MQTVIFTREYRHQQDALRTAIYPPGEFEVSNELATAAKKAGALKVSPKPRKAKADGE